MAHYKSFYDRSYLYDFDLKGKEVIVEIARVEAGELQSPGTTKKTRKPLVYFKGREKGPALALNKTNGKTIARIFGDDTDKWIGRRITLYPTTTLFGRETVGCIRVKPTEAKGPSAPPPESTIPPSEQAIEDAHDEQDSDGR